MAVTGLRGYYGVYVAITGSMWLLRGLGSMWLFLGLCGCYGVYVAVTDLRGCYGVYVAVTGSMWLSRGLCGCSGVYVAVPGSMWLLRGPRGCYGVYVPLFLIKKNSFTWLLRGQLYSLNAVEWKSTLLGVILGITSFIWSGNPLSK